TAMIQVDPGSPQLADEAIDWVLARLSGASSLDLARTEQALVDAARRRGRLTEDGPFMVSLRRELADLPPVPELPSGLTLRPVGVDDLPSGSRVTRPRSAAPG